MGFSRDHKQASLRYVLRTIAAGVLVFAAAAVLAEPPVKSAQPVRKPAAGQAKSSRIVKWVDDQGVTHYGDQLPAHYADHANTVISGKGTLLQKNEAALPAEAQARRKAEEKVLAEQQRRDKALLSTFGSEQEIDLARDRHLQQDAAAIENLQQDIASAQKRLVTDTRFAEDMKARHKPVPQELTQDIASTQHEIDRLRDQVEQRRQSMEATRQRFDEDKLRYRAAKGRSADTPPPVGVKPASSSGSR